MKLQVEGGFLSREHILSALDRTIARQEFFLHSEESRTVYEAAVQALGLVKMLREELARDP